MPRINCNSNGLLLTSLPYTWTAAADDNLYSNDFSFYNPPFEVGLWSLFISTSSGVVVVTPTLQIKYKDSVYSDDISITDYIADATNFTSPGKFNARLDTQTWWLLIPGFRIHLTRASSVEVIIDFMGVEAL